MRLVVYYTGTWARAILGTQQESPGTVGIQQRNVGSSSEGGVGGGKFPPPQVILWLAQVRVPGLD